MTVALTLWAVGSIVTLFLVARLGRSGYGHAIDFALAVLGAAIWPVTLGFLAGYQAGRHGRCDTGSTSSRRP